jgi:hypothetical protein
MAMLTRLYPDPMTEQGRADSRKHIRGFINNHPALAKLFLTGNERETIYQGRTGYPIRLEEPRLHAAIHAFAARLGMALYYDHHKQPVRDDQRVVVHWQTNLQLDQDEVLEGVLRSIGNPRTLAMGRQAFPNVFRYWSGAPEDDASRFFSFAAFRESIGLTAVVVPMGDLSENDDAVFCPGFLKGFRV